MKKMILTLFILTLALISASCGEGGGSGGNGSGDGTHDVTITGLQAAVNGLSEITLSWT